MGGFGVSGGCSIAPGRFWGGGTVFLNSIWGSSWSSSSFSPVTDAKTFLKSERWTDTVPFVVGELADEVGGRVIGILFSK